MKPPLRLLIEEWLQQLEAGDFTLNPLTIRNAPRLELMRGA